MSPTTFDETYEPRPWRCDECRQVLGVVMRDVNRFRRLWVFAKDRDDKDLPTTVDLRLAPRGLYKIHGVDSSLGVECSKCGALTEWSMSKEAFDKLLERIKMATIGANAANYVVANVDGVFKRIA